MRVRVVGEVRPAVAAPQGRGVLGPLGPVDQQLAQVAVGRHLAVLGRGQRCDPALGGGVEVGPDEVADAGPGQCAEGGSHKELWER